MSISLVICMMGCWLQQLPAQDRTGVWEGTVVLAAQASIPPYYLGAHNNTNRKSTDQSSGMGSGAAYTYRAPLPDEKIVSKATLQLIQIGEEMLAMLTAYGDHDRILTMYSFEVRPTPGLNFDYYFKGKNRVVKESERSADVFDIRGGFVQTDSGWLFRGVWENPFGGERFGYCSFLQTAAPLTMNPELLYDYLRTHKINPSQLPEDKIPIPQPVFDTILTTASSLNGNLIDNGIPDGDTLSLWLNGQIIEDNVVPGKKPFLLRINLGEKEWNYVSIRCKHEGAIKGAGILLNWQLRNGQLKYNLVLRQYHQAEWVIRRTVQPAPKLQF